MNGAHVLGRSGARLRPWVPRTLYQRGVPCAPPRLPSLPGSASLPVGAALRPCGCLGTPVGPAGARSRERKRRRPDALLEPVLACTRGPGQIFSCFAHRRARRGIPPPPPSAERTHLLRWSRGRGFTSTPVPSQP